MEFCVFSRKTQKKNKKKVKKRWHRKASPEKGKKKVAQEGPPPRPDLYSFFTLPLPPLFSVFQDLHKRVFKSRFFHVFLKQWIHFYLPFFCVFF